MITYGLNRPIAMQVWRRMVLLRLLDSGGFLLFVAVLYTCRCPIVAHTEVNVAVLPPWNDVMSHVIRSDHPQHTQMNFKTFNFDIMHSGLRKIETALRYFEDQNIHILLGPFDAIISIATEKLNVTYLATTDVTSKHLHATFQVTPKFNDFSQAFLDTVKHYNWDRVSIFYDDNKGMSVAHKLLSDPLVMIKAWQLGEVSTNKKVREYLIKMRQASMKRSILICRKENVNTIIRQAFSLAMLSTPNEWFFYDPGDELVDILEQFPNIRVNFTVFKITPELSPGDTSSNSFIKAVTEDVFTIAREVTKKPIEEQVRDIQVVRNELVNRMLQIKVQGKTGVIKFDQHGKRVGYSILIKRISAYSRTKIGEWLSGPERSGLKFESEVEISDNFSRSFPLSGRIVKVVTILEKPFCMYKRDYKVRHGNDRFEGFAIELLHEVAAMLDFEYDVHLVHDGNFGSKKDDESWDGIIGEILEGNATMSVAPLSINSDREAVVDFTNPFMTRYVSALIKIPKSDISYFEFIKPLHPLVWLCTLASLVFIALVVYVLERVGAVRSHQEPSISFNDSLWFIVSSMFKGNTNKSPFTISGRLLTSFWWIFVLVLITSYTANLTAFLTVKKIETPIKSITDLTAQTKIKFGTVQSSGIMSFFETTDSELFQTLLKQMTEGDRNTLVNSSEEGFRKVGKDAYAFFWDSTVNKYMTNENCDLMEIGPRYGPRGFGIAVPSGATYRDELSLAVLKLSDIGRLQEIENRWWKRRSCPNRDQSSETDTQKLLIENVAGVFIILACGVITASSVCFVEFTVRQISKRIHMTFEKITRNYKCPEKPNVKLKDVQIRNAPDEGPMSIPDIQDIPRLPRDLKSDGVCH